MPGNNASLGKKGEQLALDHLIALGYTIEARNYRCPFGEVDIIARDKEILVFIEVKTRRSHSAGFPEEAVTPLKQEQIKKIAQGYCAKNGLLETESRFDVISLSYEENGGFSISHFKDAF